MDDLSVVLAELSAIREEISVATDRIFDAVDAALLKLNATHMTRDDVAEVEATLSAIVEALGFQDLTGQRLTRVETLLSASEGSAATNSENSLENGPALPGGGLSQTDADAFFEDGL